MEKIIRIFISYAHEDEELCKKLENHLSLLKKQNLIDVWYDQDISAGTERKQEIRDNLNKAQLILLLISPDFMASDYCYSIEMMQAMQRHEAKTARVIPVILRPADMEGAPFRHLQALPTNASPITTWPNRDEAFLDVVEGIREVVEKMRTAEEIDAPNSQSSASVHPPKQHNLPPRREKCLLGRDKEMTRVQECLTGPGPLISIEGLPGVGKTTLALHIAYSYLPGPEVLLEIPFDYVAWVTTTNRPEQEIWLNEITDTIAKVLGHPSSTKLPIEQKKEEINQFLCRYRTLVVVDNFETIKDPDLEAWIECIPEPSKILVTSRSKQLQSVSRIQLEGLEDEAALDFIHEHAKRRELRLVNHKDKEALLDLIKFTKGNPLAIKLALQQVEQGLAWADVIKDLRAAGESMEAVFDRLFNWAWNSMNKDVRNLLMVTSFFADYMGREALSAASGLKSDSLNAAIKKLVGLMLLDNTESVTSTPHYSTHPLTRAFATRRLSNSPHFEEEARERWSQYYLKLYKTNLKPEKLKEPLKEPYWNTVMKRDVVTIDQEWPHMQKLLAWADEQRQDQLLVQLMLLLTHYMHVSFHYNDRLNYGRKAAEAAERLDYKKDAALFYIDALAWVWLEEGRLLEAEQDLAKGLQIVQHWDTNNPQAFSLKGLANTFRARARLEREEVEEALVIMRPVLSDVALYKATYNPVILVRIYMIAGDIVYKKSQYEKALEYYELAHNESLSYAEKGEEESDWELYHRRGLARLGRSDVGDIEEAEKLFHYVLDRYHDVVIIETIYAKYGLACCTEKKGDKSMARRLAEEAKKDLSDAVKSHQFRYQIQDLLTKLEED